MQKIVRLFQSNSKAHAKFEVWTDCFCSLVGLNFQLLTLWSNIEQHRRNPTCSFPEVSPRIMKFSDGLSAVFSFTPKGGGGLERTLRPRSFQITFFSIISRLGMPQKLAKHFQNSSGFLTSISLLFSSLADLTLLT